MEAMDRDIIDDLPPIRFERVSSPSTWRPCRSFSFVNKLAQVALSDTELLLTSHHLPIAIDYVDDAPQVVAILTPQFQRAPLVDTHGKWLRGYTPIALRCLPFRSADGREALEIARDLQGHDGPEFPVTDTTGAPTAEIRQITTLLRRVEAGKLRLRAAAERLLIADVLAPFQLARLPGPVHSRVLTVDRNRFSALSHRRAAHIAKDDFLAVDLAMACLFSQRLVPGPISVATESHPALNATRPPSDEIAIELKSSAQLDDSDLFSFELFASASNQK